MGPPQTAQEGAVRIIRRAQVRDHPSEETGEAFHVMSGTELALDIIQRKTTRDIPAVLGGEE